jgi:hypothetical protein
LFSEPVAHTERVPHSYPTYGIINLYIGLLGVMNGVRLADLVPGFNSPRRGFLFIQPESDTSHGDYANCEPIHADRSGAIQMNAENRIVELTARAV